MTYRGMACLISLLAASPALAQDGNAGVFGQLDVSGQFDLGFRSYTNDGRFAGQSESGLNPFMGLRLNATMGLGPGELVFQLSGLSDDVNDRSYLNLQKAYFTTSFDSWDVVLGYNIENWGVSSGRTVVNVLNARNQTNQLGRSDRIGTPMANANVFTDVGTFSLYLLGDNINDIFAGPAARQRGQIFVDDRLVRYEDDNSPDVALRFTNSYDLGAGTLDIGASLYDGTNREALILPSCILAGVSVTAAVCDQLNAQVVANYQAGATPIDSFASGGAAGLTSATPFYQEKREYGLTVVYANGNTQLRFEGFLREASGESFAGGIVGAEQSFFNVMGGDGTLIAAAEYHYDDRSDRQPLTIYDDDLFVGFTYAANDPNDTSLDFGMFYDLDASSKIYSLSMSRRVGDRVRVGLSANHISASDASDPLSAIDADSFIEFSMSAFF